MRAKLLLAASVSLVITGSLLVIWACGSSSGDTFSVDARVVGNGTVEVGHGACVATAESHCVVESRVGTLLHLQALPGNASAFAGWSGDVSGTSPAIDVDGSAGKTVVATATFTTGAHSVAVTVVGDGRVTGGGLDCRAGGAGTCTVNAGGGSTLTLTAAPDANWQFQGWSSPPGGNANPLALLVDGDKALTATFTASADYAGTYGFTALTKTFDNCMSGQVLPFRNYVVVGMSAGTPTFTFYPAVEVPPLAPVTFTASTWAPATRHAAGMSAFATTCPTLGVPPCAFCFAFQLDATFSDSTPAVLSGTLTVHGMPDLYCGSTCLQRYDNFVATRTP